MHPVARLSAIAMLACAPAAFAQWDPNNAQWGKSDPTDLRVMTWNIQDGICRTNTKLDVNNDWAALARIVAAMKPDILIMQECGDNSGEGTGSGVDTVADLTTTLSLFMHGGNDPFTVNGPVTAYVQKYAPGYDLPYVFVSGADDGFNRNVLLSRYPFADLNGDGRSTQNDMFNIFADAYAPGGTGGIRGFLFCEIDLPDAVYAGDLVMGCAHLKSGGAQSDFDDRLRASQNVAYFIDYFYNGAGTGMPDPHSRIFDNPPAQSILDANTPVIIGGDWNEDEQTNGRRGPAEWLTQAAAAGGTDGCDRDRSDSTYDSSVEFFSGSRVTQSSSKLDYIAWQDSIATIRRSFVFYSNSTPMNSLPPELGAAPSPPFAGRLLSGSASDHRPIVADFMMPLHVVPPCPADLDGDGSVGAADLAQLLGSWAGGPGPADLSGDGDVGAADLAILLGSWGPCP